MSAALKPMREIEIELHRKVIFLLDMHPFKVLYGGRDALKTHSFCRALLSLGAVQKLRILCAREIQKSIKESVHETLCSLIEQYDLGSFYTPSETDIVGRNGTRFFYSGLAGHTVESVKSFAAIDILAIFEAQTVSKRSADILLPTIREANAEVWIEFNPDMDTDWAWQFCIASPPPGMKAVKMSWADNLWMSDFSNNLRQHTLKTAPQDYGNIWEGECRTVVAGAIYAREITEMVEEGRIRPTPYDPRLPVHTVWDLGWNDAMSIIMVQKPSPSALNVVNYIEDSFKTYAEYVADLNALRYVWGTDWLPHDGASKDPKSGMSAQQVLAGLGRKVRVIGRGDVEAGIRQARMMFPRVYMDNTPRKRPTGYLGAARLVDCLKRYRRNVPTTTGEPASPVHDEFSHGADAWRGLAMIVDQIRNDGDVVTERLPMFKQPEPSMGMLG